MTAPTLDLLREVSKAGGTVGLEGDMLRLSAPEPLPDDLLARLRRHKAEIVALLSEAESANDAALIVQSVGGMPRDVADGVRAILSADGAQGIPPQRWPRVQRDVVRLLEGGWAQQALNFGWTAADLFGCDRRAPWHRLDQAGLVLLMGGHEIVELSSDVATIRSRTGSVLRHRRRPARPPVALLWGVLSQTVHRAGWPPSQATGPPIGAPTTRPSEEVDGGDVLGRPRRHPDHDPS